MKRFLAVTTLLVAVVGVLGLSDSASATNGVMSDFTNAYPATAGTALANCSTCHTSVPALNAYG
jgi:cytochrome c553